MHQITFFPVGNGDTTLIEAGATVITDIHYRKDAQDDNKNDVYDIGDDIRKACTTKNGKVLDVFVNTHPDKDHVSGFDDLFHTGSPDKWNDKSDHILVKEMWVSKYTLNLKSPTDQAKPIIKEIRRRNKLTGAEANEDGNRLKVLGSDETPTSGSIGKHLKWIVLAPNENEVAEAKTDDDERNNSSLVVRWTYKGESPSYIMLAGDAEYEVWERLHTENKAAELAWHILLAPHHCSRTPYSYKNQDGEYQHSDDAWTALAHKKGKGFIVSSSKPIKRDDDNPPHYHAKQQYLKLLGENGDTRFFNPETHGDKKKPQPVVFELSNNGPKRKLELTPTRKSKGASAIPSQYGIK